jgi:hypothetical protein
MQPVLPDSVQYPTGQVFPHPHNKRTDYDLPSLLPAVREHGILQALIGWLDARGAWLIAGHRRLACAVALLAEGDRRFETVPVRLFPEEPPAATVALIRAMENFARADLLPSQKAAEAVELMDLHKLPGREVADKLGTSEATLSRLRDLLEQPADIIAACDAGDLPMSVISIGNRVKDVDARKDLFRQFMEGHWTREKLERVVQEQSGKRKSSPRGDKLVWKEQETNIAISGTGLTVAEALEAVLKLSKKLRRAVDLGQDMAGLAKSLRNRGA